MKKPNQNTEFNLQETDLGELTRQELRVLLFSFRGYSAKEIGGIMGVSIKTVEVHKYNIFRKLNSESVLKLLNKFLPENWTNQLFDMYLMQRQLRDQKMNLQRQCTATGNSAQ
ncbi:helix-turn-helix transcriptional regulator [Flaviaesturariibacter amylovorans]|uniref:HTH luxR-type domain-containing protein n=1 Tax=Flaviaesturariibacter amylovorans TaxID=1084520 RepID=A0ABP8H733_9BACT